MGPEGLQVVQLGLHSLVLDPVTLYHPYVVAVDRLVVPQLRETEKHPSIAVDPAAQVNQIEDRGLTEIPQDLQTVHEALS